MHPVMNPELTKQTLLTTLAQRTAQLKIDLADIAKNFEPVVMASSLGPEDMVLTDVILREHLKIDIFTIDTGRLPAETYDLIERIRTDYDYQLKIYSPPNDPLEDYVNRNGINAFYQSVELRKKCCHIRKVLPLLRALEGKHAWVTGMRAEQSAARETLALHSFDADHGLDKFNPLHAWHENEIWAYIRLHKIPYSKLHDQFYRSIGCAPCTRPTTVGEDLRAGRWWWEDESAKECGLHVSSVNFALQPAQKTRDTDKTPSHN